MITAFAAVCEDDESADDWAASLLAANINPRTGLATDYLNHFNEAIMLLEMLHDMPECLEDFLAWEPVSYCDHFRHSNFKGRDLAISAYQSAPVRTRHDFDSISQMLTSILLAVRDAMNQTSRDSIRAVLAEQATGWLKPLVAHAGGVINGGARIHAGDAERQADIDNIMSA